jgi:hypothetical protein
MCRYRSDSGAKQKVSRKSSPLRQLTSGLFGPGVNCADTKTTRRDGAFERRETATTPNRYAVAGLRMSW